MSLFSSWFQNLSDAFVQWLKWVSSRVRKHIEYRLDPPTTWNQKNLLEMVSRKKHSKPLSLDKAQVPTTSAMRKKTTKQLAITSHVKQWKYLCKSFTFLQKLVLPTTTTKKMKTKNTAKTKEKKQLKNSNQRTKTT